MIFLAVAAVGSGCALFGGSDEESGTSEFDSGDVDSRGMRGEGMAEAVPELESVYFDFDRSVIRDDQKPTLRGNSSAIVSNTSWRTVVIEGHCDERGSEEYNLALGERRANAVRRYLIDLGVPASRLRTVSFGEAKPAVRGHDESAWRYNRRSEFNPGG